MPGEDKEVQCLFPVLCPIHLFHVIFFFLRYSLHSTGRPHFIVLHIHCASQLLMFLQIESLWQPSVKQVYWHCFSNSIAYFGYLCHISIIFATFQTFHPCYICCGDLWSVIFNVTVVAVLGCLEFQPHKTVNLINVCVLTASPNDHPLISLSLLRPSYSLRQSSIELKPINNLTMASRCSSERKSHTLENLNPKLVKNVCQKLR